ncbi:hypothetical protein L484_024706 [Morus notabilis]|uniref:Uncharacterized protein n=1 Tax=Morus notabilis TaxID=981085 RepID=W9RFC5_9ROSA|nr:hypothetical protein L484_024706 [Morus notabilis]
MKNLIPVPRSLGVLDGLPSRPDIVLIAPRKGADDRNVTVLINGVADLLRDRLHGLKVVLRGGGESGLDNVDAELRQLPRDVELLLRGQRHPRRLLAVAKSRVKDADVVRVGNPVRDVLRPPSSAGRWRFLVGALAENHAVGVVPPPPGIGEVERGGMRSVDSGVEEVTDSKNRGGVGGGGNGGREFTPGSLR